MEEKKVMCPLLKKPCVEDGCIVWAYLDGEPCPIGLEEDSLEAIKQALSAAARYMDEIFGVQSGLGKDAVQQVVEAIKQGKVDVRRLAQDLLKVD